MANPNVSSRVQQLEQDLNEVRRHLLLAQQRAERLRSKLDKLGVVHDLLARYAAKLETAMEAAAALLDSEHTHNWHDWTSGYDRWCATRDAVREAQSLGVIAHGRSA